jgi:hypothetical protein
MLSLVDVVISCDHPPSHYVGCDEIGTCEVIDLCYLSNNELFVVWLQRGRRGVQPVMR